MASSHHIRKGSSYEDVYKNCDYLTLHVPATPETKGMINRETLAMMKDGVKIVNLSRADLVNIDDMKEALTSGKVKRYVTDFPTEGALNVPESWRSPISAPPPRNPRTTARSWRLTSLSIILKTETSQTA